MRDSFFILMRYFLRVDNIMVRVQDVRIFHQIGKDYMLREFSRREAGLQDHPFSIDCLTDPVKLSPLLPLIFCKNEKLSFPSSS
jgi:type 2A phosphatase activator TIP41